MCTFQQPGDADDSEFIVCTTAPDWCAFHTLWYVRINWRSYYCLCRSGIEQTTSEYLHLQALSKLESGAVSVQSILRFSEKKIFVRAALSRSNTNDSVSIWQSVPLFWQLWEPLHPGSDLSITIPPLTKWSKTHFPHISTSVILRLWGLLMLLFPC